MKRGKVKEYVGCRLSAHVCRDWRKNDQGSTRFSRFKYQMQRDPLPSLSPQLFLSIFHLSSLRLTFRSFHSLPLSVTPSFPFCHSSLSYRRGYLESLLPDVLARLFSTGRTRRPFRNPIQARPGVEGIDVLVLAVYTRPYLYVHLRIQRHMCTHTKVNSHLNMYII